MLFSDINNDVYASYDEMKEDINDSDSRQFAMGIVYVVVFVISGIFILRWIHKMNHNARHLSGEHMQFTPGWSYSDNSPWYYFIPLLNLWKPYQAMVEIFKVSKQPGSWPSVKEPSVLAM